MKKCFSIILILVICLLPVVSFAAHTPLVLKGRGVYIPDETDIEIVSYNAFFRVRTGFSSADISIVVKNQNSDQPVGFIMGIPTQLDSIRKIRDISIVMDGRSIKAIQRSPAKNPPSNIETDVNRWYAWDVYLEPGEMKVIDCSFSFDNKLELDGTEIVSFPLELLNNWKGNVKNLEIIADLDFYPPYAFDPAPSMTPAQYDNGGRLTFNLDENQYFPDVFELPFKPIDVIITRYIEANSQSNRKVKDIVNSYNNKSYYSTITLIHDLLAEQSDIDIMVELKYLESLCYQKLYDFDKALNLFNQLESYPGFGDSIAPTIKNKIIYDKTAILRRQDEGDQKALDYLNSWADSTISNDIFKAWMDAEILALTPAEIEDPVTDDENDDKEDEDEDEHNNGKVIDRLIIGKYEFYIEEVLGVIALILIIFIIYRIIRRRKRRRRSSIFRY